jgi:putative ABC transport system permease protein
MAKIEMNWQPRQREEVMRASEVLHIAWEGLSRNKLRSLLTMLGVIIGVSAVIIMVAVSAGTEATIEDQITSLGTNLLYISANMTALGPGRQAGGEGNMLTFEDVMALKETLTGITGIIAERSMSETVKAGSVTLDGVTVVGTMPDYPQVRGVSLGEGRFLTLKDDDNTAKVVVLGYSLTQDLFGEKNPIGEKVLVGNVKLTVVGVMAEKGMVGNTDFDARMYVPISLAIERLTPSMFGRFMGNQINQAIVQVENKAEMDKVIFQIQLLLAKRHETTLEDLPFSIRTQQEIIDTQASTTEAFRDLLAWVAAVSLLVGGIGIMNIMLVGVTERTREIGVRQALGATPGDIRWQFLTEALMLSLVGGLIGVVTGIGGSWLFQTLGEMRTVVIPNSIFLAFGSAAIVGIFFGFYPANKASQLDPIEALRHE